MPTAIHRRLVDLACLAPSVHNTQPWCWQVDDGMVRLRADRRRQLPVEDPTGRNLVVSCGAALHHLQFAARALAVDTDVHRLPDPADPELLAEVRMRPGPRSETAAEDLDTLRTRCTDRRRFTSWPVPDAELEALAGEAEEAGALALALTDEGLRFRGEQLVNRAHDAYRLRVAALQEQDAWLARASGDDGIPLAALPAQDVEAAGRGTLVRSRFLPGLVEEAGSSVESGDGLVVLGTPADDAAGWLRTGEALSALWLRASRAGMSVVPLSLPVEMDEVRRALYERVTRRAFVPHMVVRIGWQAIGRSELPRTPRRPLAEVLG